MNLDVSAERSLLGSLLIDGRLLSRVDGLRPDDFLREEHGVVFAAIRALADRGESVDLVTVEAELEKTGRIVRAGGSVYVAALMDGVADCDNVQSYTRIVRDDARRRRLAADLDVLRLALADGARVDDVEANLRRVVAAVPAEAPPEEPCGSSLAEVLEEERGDTLWVAKNLLAIGAIASLAGDYYLGKTTLAVGLSVHVGAGRSFLGFNVPRPLPVLYWSAEGNRRMFAERVACTCFYAGIDSATLAFSLPPADFVVPFDSPDFARFVIRSGCKLVICDSAGYFLNDEANENSASDWKKYVMKPLYAIARETGASFLLTHHYSKPAENRMGRHRIRGTSAIGSDCDTVMRLEAPNGYGAPQRRLFFDKVRNEEKPRTLALTFEPAKALLVLDGAADEDVEPAPRETREEKRQAVMAEADRKTEEAVGLLFRQSPAGLTARELELAFHLGRLKVVAILGKLHAGGLIHPGKAERPNVRGQKRQLDVWKWSEGFPEAKTRQADVSPNPDDVSYAFSPRTPLSPKTRQERVLGSVGDASQDSPRHVKTAQDTSAGGGD